MDGSQSPAQVTHSSIHLKWMKKKKKIRERVLVLAVEEEDEERDWERGGCTDGGHGVECWVGAVGGALTELWWWRAFPQTQWTPVFLL